MNARHDYRAALLKLALGLLLFAGLPFAVSSAYATEDDQSIACSANCANGSCEASGEGARCRCVNGDPDCSDGASEPDCEWWYYDDGEIIIIWEDCGGSEMN